MALWLSCPVTPIPFKLLSLSKARPCLKSDIKRIPALLGRIITQGNVSVLVFVWDVKILTVLILPAKKQRAVDCVTILLDIAKESADWFPLLKAVLGGVNALIRHYEVFVNTVGTVLHD